MHSGKEGDSEVEYSEERAETYGVICLRFWFA